MNAMIFDFKFKITIDSKYIIILKFEDFNHNGPTFHICTLTTFFYM